MKSLHNEKYMVLAGDIGGTKTSLGLYEGGRDRPRLKIVRSFGSLDAPNLESLITRFVEFHPVSIQAACFGIAGPVIEGESKATNLPWKVSEKHLKRRFKWSRISLLNDLAATALALPVLSGREIVSLNRMRGRKDGNRVLVAPGTGLGQSLLVFDNGRHISVASEGGHVDFAPLDEYTIALWRHLRERFGHVSPERLLSGPGLVNIYSWLIKVEGTGEPVWLTGPSKEQDHARIISESALQGRDRLCEKALDLFVSILGAVSGNLALTGMATGGVYLGGGIPPKILPFLKKDLFMEAFTAKGRFNNFLKKIPVRVILNERAALLGAARYALTPGRD